MLYFPAFISPVLADTTALVIWLSVGLLALVIGAVGVAVSRRRILLADRDVVLTSRSSAPQLIAVAAPALRELGRHIIDPTRGLLSACRVDLRIALSRLCRGSETAPVTCVH